MKLPVNKGLCEVPYTMTSEDESEDYQVTLCVRDVVYYPVDYGSYDEPGNDAYLDFCAIYVKGDPNETDLCDSSKASKVMQAYVQRYLLDDFQRDE